MWTVFILSNSPEKNPAVSLNATSTFGWERKLPKMKPVSSPSKLLSSMTYLVARPSSKGKSKEANPPVFWAISRTVSGTSNIDKWNFVIIFEWLCLLLRLVEFYLEELLLDLNTWPMNSTRLFTRSKAKGNLSFVNYRKFLGRWWTKVTFSLSTVRSTSSFGLAVRPITWRRCTQLRFFEIF